MRRRIQINKHEHKWVEVPDEPPCVGCGNGNVLSLIGDAPLTLEPAGVCIGSYKMPEVVDLNIRVIRASCGPVPILVNDDASPDGERLAAICKAHSDVTLHTNKQRIGHTGGDVSAYHNAVVWAAKRGLKVVAKISQRWICTVPRWLQEHAGDLLASGLPMASQRCRGKEVFDLRTEAALLDVRQWNHGAILKAIEPRRYWKDSPNGLSAETIIYRALQDFMGGVYWPWRLLWQDRYAQMPGVLWHCANHEEEYRELAAAHGVTLPTEFHCEGWERDAEAGKYLYG